MLRLSYNKIKKTLDAMASNSLEWREYGFDHEMITDETEEE